MQPIVDQKKYADFFGCRFDQKSETFDSFARNAAPTLATSWLLLG